MAGTDYNFLAAAVLSAYLALLWPFDLAKIGGGMPELTSAYFRIAPGCNTPLGMRPGNLGGSYRVF